MKKYLSFLSLLLLPFFALSQGAQVEFGKNRVQFHDFEWWQYESQNFITYWYRGGQNIGQSVVQLAEFDYEEIRSTLEYRINDKIEILVYNDLTDLKQSNVGNDEVFLNTSGITKIVGNKIFVYFDGNHNNLRRQIREGVAQVLLNNMMFGVNLQEIVQNAVLLNLPPWFTDGLVAYIGTNWNASLDNRLRDGILSGEIEDFTDLVEQDAKFAGQTFWFFIAQNYGKSTVSNLLYLTRINRSVESGFLYVLGSTYEQAIASWQKFYERRYQEDNTVRIPLSEDQKITYKNKRKLPISTVKLSPDGKKIAYVQNEIGKYKVYLQDIATGDRTMIFRNGYRNPFQATDYNYPLLAWTPNSQKIAIAYEKQDVIKLQVYDITTKKATTEDFAPKFDRILSMDFMNGREIVMTALEAGYSDIFTYDIATRSGKQITNDYHDDLEVAFVEISGRKGIIFSSNRRDSLLLPEKLDTILPIKDFDLWYYDLEIKNNPELVRITRTPLANERSPIAINSRYFGFLSDKNGIYNRYVGYIDTVFAYKEKVILLKDETEVILPLDSTLNTAAENIDTTFIRDIYKPKGFYFPNTNLDRSILEQHTAPRVNKVVDLVQNQQQYAFYLHNLTAESKANPSLTAFKKNELKLFEEDKKQKLRFEEQQKKIAEANKKLEETKAKLEAAKIKKDTVPTPVPVDTAKVETPKPVVKKDSTATIDIDNYFFQSEFEDVQPVKPTTVIVDKEGGETIIKPTGLLPKEEEKETPIHKFKRSRITPYRTTFKSDFVTTTLDNSLLFDGRIPFGEGNLYNYPTPGILLMGNIVDLFEDYRIQGGVRIPTTFNGAEYFLRFSDLSKRLDKRLSFYRRSIRESGPTILTGRLSPNNPVGTYIFEDATTQTVSNLIEAQAKWPLDVFRSVRGTAIFRTDNRTYLANNFLALDQDVLQQQRVGLKLEYVFDNTLDVSMNIKNGTRYKIFSEVQKRFSVEIANEGIETDFQGGWLGLVGLDARHYQRLDKHSIFAVRLAGASSFGDEKILYFLGGTDNWLLPNFADQIPIADEEYAYQTLATNLRGFGSNVRNGSSYAVANMELRVPIMKYLSRKPIKSAFLRNFQAVGFFDIGTAWEGLSPFNDDNPLNTIIIDNPPINIKVNYFRNPIVAGYGFGVRSTLFGYFVRLDYAWGIETGVVQDPRLYLSLGMDF